MSSEGVKADTVQVSIPTDLVNRVTARLSANIQFESPDDCIIYALEEYLTSSKPDVTETKGTFSKEEEQVIENRLKELGYT